MSPETAATYLIFTALGTQGQSERLAFILPHSSVELSRGGKTPGPRPIPAWWLKLVHSTIIDELDGGDASAGQTRSN